MKAWIVFFFLVISNAFGADVDYQTFQKILEDPSFQKMLESDEGKKILSSHKPGLPTSEEEFSHFSKSIAFWKLRKTPAFKKLVPQENKEKKADVVLKVTEKVAPAPKKKRVKTERERYLEQFMVAKVDEPEVRPTVEIQPAEIQPAEEEELEQQLGEIEKESKKILAMVQPNEKGEIDLGAVRGAGKVVDGEGLSLMDNPDLVVAQLLAPYQKLSEEQIEADIRAKTKGRVAEKIFDYIPKLPLFIAKLLRSEEAFPAMAKISVDKKRLMIYLGLNIATIVLGFILKRLTATEMKISKQFKNFFVRIFVLYTLRIGLVVFFFKDEFAPAAKIFMKTFF